MVAPQLSLFERLPYDVRISIYSYLEPGELPPFTRGFLTSTSGFILSCRHAKRDLDDIAATRFVKARNGFLAAFESSTGLTPHISESVVDGSPGQLRRITIALPWSSVHYLLGRWMWKREVLAGLHPLFSAFFNTVQVHFSGLEDQPVYETQLNRGRVEVSMHSLLRDIGYMIERVNRQETGGEGDIPMGVIFESKAGILEKYPGARVSAKRICLSWNLSSSLRASRLTSDALVLNGKRHRQPCGNTGDRSDSASFYHLRNEQRTMAEMGITDDARWTLLTPGQFSVLLNASSTVMEYCSSESLGGNLRPGLRGIDENSFEVADEEISKLIYT